MTSKDGTTVETEERIDFAAKESSGQLDGTVQLTCDEGLLLIPTPSTDPQDPLNIPLWQKLLILATTCLYSTMGLTAVSGLGGILVFFIPEYSAQGKTYADVSYLMTFPSLFMGLGNMVSMPIAIAVGRRPVFIVSCIMQVVALILCATNNGYEWHFAARCVLGLAAGQSEALCPLIVSEVFFLHERAKYQQLFSSLQTVLSGTLIILTSYIASSVGWRAWYYIFCGFSAVVLILAVFFVPETKYNRPMIAYKGVTVESGNSSTLVSGSDLEDLKRPINAMTIHDERILDTVNFAPRTMRSNMRLFVNKPDWPEGAQCLKHMFQVFLFPNVCWIVSMNGIFLGINIAMGLTYGHILSENFHWADKYLSIAQAGQIVVAFLCVPMLGMGSDWIVKKMAVRKGGVHEPEHRLLTLVIPLLLGIMWAVLYGQAAAHPERFHWLCIVFSINGYFFTFIGANTAGITYCLDAYPTRAAASLVLIAAGRGVISFGLSYGTVSMYSKFGYDGAFGLFGGLTAAFGVLGVAAYVYGKQIRKLVSPWTAVKDAEKPTMG